MNLVIVDYGAGNIQSVIFALQRLGVTAVLTSDPEQIRLADKVLFPGVGEAAFAMQQLQSKNLDVLIPQLKQPVLGICLGMQLLCNHSEEGNTKALGVFPVEVKKFAGSLMGNLKVPHVGWNTFRPEKSRLFAGLQEQEFVYYVHSYYAAVSPFTSGKTEYGLKFSASLEKDNFFAVQFHPEKSGAAGEQILRNFLSL